MPARKRWLLVGLLAVMGALVVIAATGERDRSAGEIRGPARSSARLAAARARVSSLPTQHAAAKQVLFGDLHVHSTFSIDAFLYALPLFAGEGAHPPAGPAPGTSNTRGAP